MKRILLILSLLTMTSVAFAQNTEEDPDVQYASCIIAPGTPAPDFTLPDISDHSVSLNECRGSYVLLVFWASWCPDCRAEVPALKAMAEKYPDVMILGVSFDRTQQKWRDYVFANELPGVQLFDAAGKQESTVAAAYGVQWIPSLLVISPDGVVELRTVVAERADAFLAQKLPSE